MADGTTRATGFGASGAMPVRGWSSFDVNA
jgi:hypothetical protein